MRTRSLGLTLFAGLSILVAACNAAATTAPSVAPSVAPPSVAPSVEPSVAPTPTPTPAPTPAPGANLKIGVVTDIGTLNDKNFNEYTYKGAQQGATDIGAANPPAVVPKDQSEYAKDIQDFVDQKFDIIVTIGFNMTSATTVAAKANPDTWFIGVDQTPCVDETGADDATFACKGDAATLLPHYVSITFKEDQAGYLAGIVAAAVTKTNEIGAIGGTTLCAPCVRYIQGYELGAKSVNPKIVVKTAYVTRDFSAAAFTDQPGGKAFANNFLTTNKKVDVMFQVAGLTGNGVLDAACDKGINGIGVDVDQFLSYPAAGKCLVTSAEKHLQSAVSQAINAIANNTAKGGNALFDATNDGIGVSPFHDMASVVPADVQAKLDAALAAMKAGTLVTCPADGCGVGPS
jgi:basic membrane protein A and related proteins